MTTADMTVMAASRFMWLAEDWLCWQTAHTNMGNVNDGASARASD